jgi:ZIP family zinc transporter
MSFFDLSIGAATVLLATSAGAFLVMFFGCMDERKKSAMLAFSSGAMVFSSLEMLSQSSQNGDHLIMLGGFVAGVATLYILERIIPHVHQHIRKKELEGPKKKVILIGGAIALHNIPEGLAIATAFAASNQLGWFVALTLAIQDIPEGILIAAPLVCYGMSKTKAVGFGIFSGVVETVAAILGYLFLSSFSAIIPWALAFSAGAMVYVILVELLPDAFSRGMKKTATISFLLGAIITFALAAFLII